MLALGYVNRFGPPRDKQKTFLFKNTIIYIYMNINHVYIRGWVGGRGGGGQDAKPRVNSWSNAV